MIIAICASMDFYRDVMKIKLKLESMGHEVLVPDGALQMESDGDFDKQRFFLTYYGEKADAGKAQAIKGHFNKIAKADAILVINNTKHGKEGYIGPNVLMEMGLAFFFTQKIFVLNAIPQSSPFIEEINAMAPIYLNGDLNALDKVIGS